MATHLGPSYRNPPICSRCPSIKCQTMDSCQSTFCFFSSEIAYQCVSACQRTCLGPGTWLFSKLRFRNKSNNKVSNSSTCQAGGLLESGDTAACNSWLLGGSSLNLLIRTKRAKILGTIVMFRSSRRLKTSFDVEVWGCYLQLLHEIKEILCFCSLGGYRRLH